MSCLWTCGVAQKKNPCWKTRKMDSGMPLLKFTPPLRKSSHLKKKNPLWLDELAGIERWKPTWRPWVFATADYFFSSARFLPCWEIKLERSKAENVPSVAFGTKVSRALSKTQNMDSRMPSLFLSNSTLFACRTLFFFGKCPESSENNVYIQFEAKMSLVPRGATLCEREGDRILWGDVTLVTLR